MTLAQGSAPSHWVGVAGRGTAGVFAIAEGIEPAASEVVPAGHQWQRRPALSALVRVAVVVLPAAAGIGAGLGMSRLLPRPNGLGPAALSFAAVSIVIVVTIVAVERAGRRLLPLAALLNLSLLFPDRAPKRFAIARRVGKPRDLQRQLQEARDKGVKGGDTAYMQKVLELVAALSVHDRQTRGHSERVRVFADLIADEMKLAPSDRARLRWASLLHDIGKLVVPSAILSKPAKLTNAEFDAVKRHPDEGARLIGPLSTWLGEWADAVPQHHERFDGRGYPRGLSGDRISLAGRIVAVADSYEVMTAVRPYRKPVSVSAARQELVKCSGSQFDPVVVRAFLNISMGRLWRVVGFGSWIAQLPLIGWIDRLGWNWGAAVISGTTAIALTGPGVIHGPSPGPGPTSGISTVSTGGQPAQSHGGTTPTSPGAPTSGTAPPGQTATPAPGGGTTLPGGPTPPPGSTPSPTVPGSPAASPTPGPTSTPAPTPTPVPDLPPVVTVKTGGVAVLGSFAGSGSFTDSDLADHTFTATVNYGDGSGVHTLALSGTTFVLAHSYSTVLRSYPITVIVTDDDGVSGSGSTTVTVVL